MADDFKLKETPAMKRIRERREAKKRAKAAAAQKSKKPEKATSTIKGAADALRRRSNRVDSVVERSVRGTAARASKENERGQRKR